MNTKTTIAGLLGLLPFALFSQAFVKVTDASNPITNYTFPPDYLYCGAAWVDVDNDGDIDLFAAPDRLFENLGGGKFQNKTTAIGSNLSPGKWPFAGCSWADVDNDGDTDCFLTFATSRLYLNNGSGGFSAHTTAPLNAANKGWAGALGDFDDDRYPDIVIAKPIDPNNPGRGKLFISNGKLNWENATGYEFTDTDEPFTVPTWADFDDDGDLDLFIASGPAFTGAPGFDFIYRNNLKESQSATLTRIKNLPFASELQDGQSYSFVDYDNDGRLDICLANYQYAPNRLYRNTGPGVWTSVSAPFTDPAQILNLSNAWGDFDNDGDLDVIFTRDGDLPARLFLNDGAGKFTLDAGSPVSQQLGASGASIGDYDNDGDLDVFLSGKTEGSKGRALFRNDLTGLDRHWVSFKLTGVTSNRTALGARVRIKVKIKGKSLWLRRDVSAQNTFQGHNDLRVHFGLGDAVAIDSFEVRFPSGKTTTCQGMAADRFYTIVEKNGVWDDCSTPVAELVQADPLNIAPNPAHSEIAIRLPAEENPADLRLEIMNSTGRRVLEQAFSGKIGVAQLPPGFYLLTVRGTGKIWSGRFVKK